MSDATEIAEEIVSYLTSRFNPEDKISLDFIDKQCYEAVADLKGNIFDNVIDILEKEGMKVKK